MVLNRKQRPHPRFTILTPLRRSKVYRAVQSRYTRDSFFFISPPRPFVQFRCVITCIVLCKSEILAALSYGLVELSSQHVIALIFWEVKFYVQG
jgi:hypothetical protein